MKNLKALIILTLIPILTYSQDYKTSFGRTFKVGDTVIVGNYTYKNHYRNIYSSPDFGNSPICTPLNKYIITEIVQNDAVFKRKCNDPNAVRVKIATKKGPFGLISFVNIEPAIRDGEIVLRINPERVKTSILPLDAKSAYLFFIEQSKLGINVLLKQYLYNFEPVQFKLSQKDEFEKNSIYRVVESQIRKDLSNLDSTRIYSLATQVELGEYDFSRGGFAIDISNTTFKLIDFKRTEDGLFPGIGIGFINNDKVNLLKVSPEEANSFIKRRTKYTGSIDRKCYALYNFKIIQIAQSDLNDYPVKEYYMLKARIVSIEFYDSPNFVYNWLGTVQY